MICVVMRKSTTSFSNEKREMLRLMCEQINAAWHQMRTTWMAYEMRMSEVSPRESAAWKKEVSRHNDRIADLQLTFDTFIVTSCKTETGHLPMPEFINIQQTMIRYGKGF